MDIGDVNLSEDIEFDVEMKTDILKVVENDYTNIENKPSINGVELKGNKTLGDLSIPSQADVEQAIQESLNGMTADDITFEDGQTFQEKYNNGSLKGERGVQGETGPIGPKGDKGDTGEQGMQGEVGPAGPRGEKGDVGETGPKGNDGEKGERGVQGLKGDNGIDGFSPTIIEKTNTDTEYVLTITDNNGSFDTPNLKGQNGTSGGEVDLKSSKVFFWNGKPSLQDETVLPLFKEIQKENETTAVIIVSTYEFKETIFVLRKGLLSASGSNVTIKGVGFTTPINSTITEEGLQTFQINQLQFTVEITNNNIVSVANIISNPSLLSLKVLNGSILNSSYDGKYFTPTKSYHPVSKGYLDETIGKINTILDTINGEVV